MMSQYGLEAIGLSLWFYYCTPSFHHMIAYFPWMPPAAKDANNISYDNLISMTAMAAHEVSWVGKNLWSWVGV